MAPPRLPTLAAIEAAIWQELARAPHDKHHEWRTPVLATLGADGADARTVVLREVQAPSRGLTLYTDARAGKVRQLRACPQGMLVLWSKRLGWQLRCRLTCQVQDSGAAVAARWAQVQQTPAAHDYLAPAAPGSTLANPSAGARPDAVAANQRVPGHAAHFALVQATVTHIDWLELHREGHRRAAFDAGGGRFLVP